MLVRRMFAKVMVAHLSNLEWFCWQTKRCAVGQSAATAGCGSQREGVVDERGPVEGELHSDPRVLTLADELFGMVAGHLIVLLADEVVEHAVCLPVGLIPQVEVENSEL